MWDRYVLLDLADDGCGMTSATLSQIFDPFFTTKKAGQVPAWGWLWPTSMAQTKIHNS